MRITQSMVTANTLNNINNVYSNLQKYQNQVSTGKKVTMPSDDPIATTKGMYYTSQLNSISQYQKNVSTLQNWMSNSGTGITQVSNDISKIHTLVDQAANGTYNANDLQTISTEVEQIKQDMVNTANTQVAGNYIFHGSAVTSSPVSQLSDGSYNVDTTPNDLNIEVSDGISVRANVKQGNIFGSGTNNIFNTVDGIINDLNNNNTGNLSNDLTSLDTYSNVISGEQADLGARQNQVDTVSTRLTQQQTSATQGLSDNIDADFEQAVMNMSTQQTAYQAALNVGAKIIQPSLLDYLGGSTG